MRFVELTLADGSPVTINPALITCFQPGDDGTLIVFIAGGSIQVRESYDAVAEIFGREHRPGD